MNGLALDAALLTALVLIGISLYLHAPALIGVYVGVVLLGAWWVIGSGRAAKKKSEQS